MKRFLTAPLILGVFSLFGLVGCGEQSKVTEKTEVSTPGGTSTTTTETKVDTTGSNPPPPTSAPVEAPK